MTAPNIRQAFAPAAAKAILVIIPPGSFRLAIQNNSGFTLTSGTQTVKYRTYNINLNS